MAGSITPYNTAAGKRYRVRYRKPDKTQTDKRGFKTKREAELFLASVTVAKASGGYLDPAEGRKQVAVFAEQWKTGRLASLKPSSRAAMETSWRVHVAPRWAARTASSIRPSEVEDWIASLSRERGAQTVRRAVFVFSSILAIAERDGVIARNPCKGVALPAKRPKPRRYLTYRQVELLARHASDEHADHVYELAYGGTRWGESVALRVRHLNFLRRRIRVEDNAVIVHGVYEIGTPKSGKPRDVPMHPFLVDRLSARCIGRGPNAFVFGDGIVPAPYPHATSGWFAKAVRASQADDSTFPLITPHDLRHTAASLAISAGANVKAVQRMLGHASAAMTLDVYADLFDDDLDAVAAAMTAARAEAIA
ncbi:site-specific integrase [Microbacterium sp. 2FI]|uniref:site-specific integrase n=1 Tax=Microbacterium sp. 2FI TaxID=2502193 RepID=UPI0010F6FC28|nr:site-specific integrase [Microbacterium sp. 2FI]